MGRHPSRRPLSSARAPGWLTFLVWRRDRDRMLCGYGFDDADDRGRWNHATQPEAGLLEQTRVLALGLLLPAGEHQHDQILELALVRRVSFGQGRFDDEQAPIRSPRRQC